MTYGFPCQDISLSGHMKGFEHEGERLQTFPNGYTAGVSDTARYKVCGNGWTVDIVANILKGVK